MPEEAWLAWGLDVAGGVWTKYIAFMSSNFKNQRTRYIRADVHERVVERLGDALAHCDTLTEDNARLRAEIKLTEGTVITPLRHELWQLLEEVRTKVFRADNADRECDAIRGNLACALASVDSCREERDQLRLDVEAKDKEIADLLDGTMLEARVQQATASLRVQLAAVTERDWEALARDVKQLAERHLGHTSSPIASWLRASFGGGK